jgi:hypothetical protein
LSGARSKEHVLPEWLQTHLGVAGHKAPLLHAGTLERRGQTADAYREGRVCDGCNNRCMSDLETAAQPILKPLMDGKSTLSSLAGPDRDLLSRWFVKTALMLASTSLGGPAHRPRFYGDIRAGRLPNRMVVVGHQQPPVERFPDPMEIAWLVNPEWLSPPPYTAADQARYRKLGPVSFKVTLWTRHLYLTAAYWPDHNWEVLRWRGVHVPVSVSAAALGDHPWDPPPPGTYSDELTKFLHDRLAVRMRQNRARRR